MKLLKKKLKLFNLHAPPPLTPHLDWLLSGPLWGFWALCLVVTGNCTSFLGEIPSFLYPMCYYLLAYSLVWLKCMLSNFLREGAKEVSFCVSEGYVFIVTLEL